MHFIPVCSRTFILVFRDIPSMTDVGESVHAAKASPNKTRKYRDPVILGFVVISRRRQRSRWLFSIGHNGRTPLTWVVYVKHCIKEVFRGKSNLAKVRCSKDFWEIMWDKVCKYERMIGAYPPKVSSLSEALNPLPSYSSLNWTVPLFRLSLSPSGLKVVCDGIRGIWEDSIKIESCLIFF